MGDVVRELCYEPRRCGCCDRLVAECSARPCADVAEGAGLVRDVERCGACGVTATWVPTFCNHGHCAECFDGLEPEHAAECAWDGSEHESYAPASSLPGNVWIHGDPTKCAEHGTVLAPGEECYCGYGE